MVVKIAVVLQGIYLTAPRALAGAGGAKNGVEI